MIITPDKQAQLAALLGHGAEGLDVSPEMDERLTGLYRNLAAWLRADNLAHDRVDSRIYPQGSRLLGTLVAPLDPRDDYDIDLVYERVQPRTSLTQRELKDHVGNQLRRYVAECDSLGHEEPALQEGRRCWTLEYQGLHVDVLPALPEDPERDYDGSVKATEVIIADRKLFNWQPSNPQGYASWFQGRMATVLAERRDEMAKSAGVSVQDVPTESVKTPLQRVVQLLKRHRDVTCAGDPADKPISIIITTLAANAYNNERNLFDALLSVVGGMRSFIREHGGAPWVGNPVNPKENFADKWQSNPVRARRCLEWLETVEEHLGEAAEQTGLDKVAGVLSKGWGQTVADESLRRFGKAAERDRRRQSLRASAGAATLGSSGPVVVPKHTFYGDEES